jgi:uncharacterized cupredoxin-like copper-binding protein
MRGFATFATIALVAGAAGCGSGDDDNATTAAATTTAATTKAPAGSVAVTMKEFTVSPAPASVPAGKVTFKVTNEGKVKHEFVVLKTTKAAGDLLKGDEADESGNVGEIGDLPAGSSKNLSLMLKAGHYALICNLPRHYKAGQFADFTVK